MKGISVTIDTLTEHAEQLTRDALAAEGFGILAEIDVAASFANKLGITRPALKILGAFNPRVAYAAISPDRSTALLLPCNVVIEQTDHGVTVTAADPRQLLDDPRLDELASDAAGRLTQALEALGTHSDPG